jgi:hypothetical protein
VTGVRDEQLRTDFVRIRDVDVVPCLEVAVVEWHGPQTPELRWEVAQHFASTPSREEVRVAEQSVLEDSRYFGRCSMCGERCNVGHMHSGTVCQGCAEEHLGVVH